ncbi:uncharacterized protein K441DRAFT_555485, partial [Cenococcum geophilum 1.58]|uniref:uncharacterized protein n=1 Tax=Cenococcum geophilum 1.58 TaxID=794803 RepID=UPI00358F12B3
KSPRFLMKHGYYRKALESFCIIQPTPLLAARDLMYAHAQLEDNPHTYQFGVNGYWRRLSQLFSEPRCTRALLSAVVAMITQQMTGVNTIAFLSTTVYKNSFGADISAEVIASAGLAFGAANYIFGLPAYWPSEKYGRSIMLPPGPPNPAWLMPVFAFCFKIPDGSPARTPLISIFAMIFVMVYSPTGGTSPPLISAEVFPLVTREVGVAVNLLGAGILVPVFPWPMNAIGITGASAVPASRFQAPLSVTPHSQSPSIAGCS